MKKIFMVLLCVSVVFLNGCSKETPKETTTKLTTKTEKTTNETTTEIKPVAEDFELSVDEVIDIFNTSIKNAKTVRRNYKKVKYDKEKLNLPNEMLKNAAIKLLDSKIKNNVVPNITNNKVLPNPSLAKNMIKWYNIKNCTVSLFLFDIENPNDKGCLNLCPVSVIFSGITDYGFSVEDFKLNYTDCRINLKIDKENLKLSYLDYSWTVKASGNAKLLMKRSLIGIDVNVKESFNILE